MQIGKPEKNSRASREHWKNLEDLRKNFAAKNDRRLGLALLGAEIAFRCRWSYEEVDFNSPATENAFREVERLTSAQIGEILRRGSPLSLSFLPPAMRQEALSRIRNRRALSFENAGVWKYLARTLFRKVVP